MITCREFDDIQYFENSCFDKKKDYFSYPDSDERCINCCLNVHDGDCYSFVCSTLEDLYFN